MAPKGVWPHTITLSQRIKTSIGVFDGRRHAARTPQLERRDDVPTLSTMFEELPGAAVGDEVRQDARVAEGDEERSRGAAALRELLEEPAGFVAKSSCGGMWITVSSFCTGET